MVHANRPYKQLYNNKSLKSSNGWTLTSMVEHKYLGKLENPTKKNFGKPKL